MKKSTVIIIVAVILGIGLLGIGGLVAGGLILKNKVATVLKSDEAQTLLKEVKEGSDQKNDEQAQNTSSLKAACEYYTKEEAESIIGTSVAEKTDDKENGNDLTSCMYTSDLSKGEFSLTSFIIADAQKTTSKTAFATARGLMKGATESETVTVSVAGADDAFWVDKAYQLNVLKDTHWFIFTTYSGSDTVKYKDLTIKQAELILKKF